MSSKNKTIKLNKNYIKRQRYLIKKIKHIFIFLQFIKYLNITKYH